MESVLIEVRDNTSGSETTINLGEFHAVWGKGVLVGSGKECDVILNGPAVLSNHLRLHALSNHKFVEILPGATAMVYGQEVGPGKKQRVDDGEITVGHFTIRIVGGSC